MYIKVRVIAGAKKEDLTETKEGYFTASVKERAERNQANTRVVELIATRYSVPTTSVRIISGHHHPIKMLSVGVE